MAVRIDDKAPADVRWPQPPWPRTSGSNCGTATGPATGSWCRSSPPAARSPSRSTWTS
ncbi:hypothetical protein KCH_08520 [Kitasatospora cheerisanensis KCTC 2395]|uniref:Uncharacterized protein n=1 Tax=Kitasatospora cheerisanensis KCTC 2395 TaxID=1348663 RepID=A0A066ZAM3_9ACTN|nr:hypothetical protein KCH_08520 [Kitasatospora cheerisanensis KCTC 2395]